MREDAGGMKPSVQKAVLADILPMRAQYLAEMNCQIRFNACHERGWTDSWRLLLDGVCVGYSSTKGRVRDDRDTVFELFVLKTYRRYADDLFRELVHASEAAFVECQSNDALITSLLFEHSSSVSSDVMLFEDHLSTDLLYAGGTVRPRQESDIIFEHTLEPVGDYVLEAGGEVIATGGFLLHYNEPFADLYMEVRKDRRERGAGAFLLQEVKKFCLTSGRIPAARCDMRNVASRLTLTKAGMRPCRFVLMGRLDRLSA